MVNFLVQEKQAEQILPENTEKTLVPQVEVPRAVKTAPPRYRNEIAKYIVRRSSDCNLCGKCAQVCPYGVHVLKPGYKNFAAPHNDACIGPSCQYSGHYCIDQCPQKALKLVENPQLKCLGDYRWTPDVILATWKMAETGTSPLPEYNYDYETGASGGGFDRLRFKFPAAYILGHRSQLNYRLVLLNPVALQSAILFTSKLRPSFILSPFSATKCPILAHHWNLDNSTDGCYIIYKIVNVQFCLKDHFLRSRKWE